MVRRVYQYLDAEVMMYLYKGLIRPRLEYGVVVWAPYLQKNIEAIEAVQRRATRFIPSIKHLPYEDPLWKLRLPMLTCRRYRGDMIQA